MRCLLLSVVACLFATSLNAFPYSDNSYQHSSIDVVEFEKAIPSDLNADYENLDGALNSADSDGFVSAADPDHPGCVNSFGKRQISTDFVIGIFPKFQISSLNRRRCSLPPLPADTPGACSVRNRPTDQTHHDLDAGKPNNDAPNVEPVKSSKPDCRGGTQLVCCATWINPKTKEALMCFPCATLFSHTFPCRLIFFPFERNSFNWFQLS